MCCIMATAAYPHTSSCNMPCAAQVLRKWVSRFDLWPYVEQYTLDVQREIMAGTQDWPCMDCEIWGLLRS
jgi:hypothetical protein